MAMKIHWEKCLSLPTEKIRFMYDVFISYSRKDYYDEATKSVIPDNVVSKIKELLHENGIRYWFDEDGIYSGDEFLEKIAKSISESKILLFLSTKNSNASAWTSKEISAANHLKKKIIPFRIDDSNYNFSTLLLLSDLDHIEYYKDENNALKSLIESIKKYLRELDEKKIAEAKNLQKQERIGNLNNEIGRLKNQQDAQKAAIKKNLASIKVDKETYNELVKKIEAAEDELYLLQHGFNREHKSLDLYLDDEDKLRERIKELENQINALNNEKQELLLKIELLERNVAEYKKRNEDVSEKLSGCEKENARLNGELSRANNENVVLERRLDEKEKEFFYLKEKNEKCVKDLNCQISLKAGLEKEKQTLEIKLKNFEVAQTQDKLHLDKCKKEKDELLKKIAAIEKELAEERAIFQDKTILCKGIPIEMVAVKGGTFWMGAQKKDPKGRNYDSGASDSEGPVHQVTLSDYYIGKFEVTQELWQSVMGCNPSEFKGNKNPVENISWDECQDFIRELNQLTGKKFRLPTEAEWEYAARGGIKSKGYRYSGSNNVKDVAWYTDTTNDSGTKQVGTKSPNELGIYDMSGNVYEWCQDWYGSYGSGSQRNPTGASPDSFRVLRNCSWDDMEYKCRVSKRTGDFHFKSCSYYGFRIALVP